MQSTRTGIVSFSSFFQNLIGQKKNRYDFFGSIFLALGLILNSIFCLYRHDFLLNLISNRYGFLKRLS